VSENLTGRLAIKARQIRPGMAQMIEVKQGQLVQIVDVQGKQVADFVAFNGHDRAEYLSVAVTRGANNNVMLQQGQTLYSNRRNPMLEITEDTVGRHDTLFAACDPKRYEALEAPGHANCRTALADALQGFGVDYDHIPDPVNWFMNVAIRQRGELEIREPLSERGDQVQLTALMDLVIAVSACPQDLLPTNGTKPSDILIRVYREAPATAAPETEAEATSEAPGSGEAEPGDAEAAAAGADNAPGADAEAAIEEVAGIAGGAQPADDSKPV
jgi:uncharacterized protein YcgI (DUF1989 family)